MADALFLGFTTNLAEYLVSPLSFIKQSLFNYSKNEVSHRTCWEDLPDEIVESIFQRLSKFDRIRVSAVNKSCFQHIKNIPPSAPQLPWLLINDLKFFDLCDGKVGDLKISKRFKRGWLVGCSKGWWVYAERSSTHLPWNLIYRAKDIIKKKWPSLHTYNYIPWNLLYRAKNIIKKKWPSLHTHLSKFKEPSMEADLFLFNPISRALHQLPSLSTIPEYKHYNHQYSRRCASGCFSPLITLSSPDISELIVAFVIHEANTDEDSPILALCRPGDEEWGILYGGEGEKFLNMIFYKGKLCMVSNCVEEDVEHCTIELEKDQVSVTFIPCHRLYRTVKLLKEAAIIGKTLCPVPYLVESTNGELLVIIKATLAVWNENPKYWRVETGGFFLFKIDPDSSDFQKILDIGDQIVFLGTGGPLSFSARAFPGFRGNSIYFTEEVWPSRESGVYYLENGKLERSLPAIDSIDEDKLERFLGVDSPSWAAFAWFTPHS